MYIWCAVLGEGSKLGMLPKPRLPPSLAGMGTVESEVFKGSFCQKANESIEK